MGVFLVALISNASIKHQSKLQD